MRRRGRVGRGEILVLLLLDMKCGLLLFCHPSLLGDLRCVDLKFLGLLLSLHFLTFLIGVLGELESRLW